MVLQYIYCSLKRPFQTIIFIIRYLVTFCKVPFWGNTLQNLQYIQITARSISRLTNTRWNTPERLQDAVK